MVKTPAILKSPAQVAKKIGFPVKRWPGNCYYVASLLLKHKIVRGDLCYGIYDGYIDADAQCGFGRRSFTHHGWIETKDKIIDPTRWVFENVKPYIHIGPKSDEYDFGGNRLRESFMQPPPTFNIAERTFNFSMLEEEAKLVVKCLVYGRLSGDELAKAGGFVRNEISIQQLFWLANLPLDMFQGHEKQIYKWIVKIGQGAYLPMDNRRRILGGS